MLKITKILCVLTFFLFQFSGFAQYNFRPGYIVDHKNDTSQVLIDHQTWNVSPNAILIKESLDAPIKEFGLVDIKYFEVGNEAYYNKSVAVNTPTTSFDHSKIPVRKEPVYQKRNLFIRKYVSGKINLYILDDLLSMKHFYVQKHNDSLIPLTYVKYIDTLAYNPVNPSESVFIYSQYKYTLAEVMQDRPDLISKINSIGYNQKDLVKLLKEYNGETFSTHIINREPVPPHLVPNYKFYVQPGVIIGYNRTSKTNQDINKEDYVPPITEYEPNNVSPLAGLTLNMFSEKNPYISFYSEVIFQKASSTTSYTRKDDVGYIYVDYREVVDQISLVPLLAARYQPRINSKARLYVLLGVNYTIAVHNQNIYDELHRSRGFIQEEIHERDKAIQNIGATMGIGCALKNLSFDARIFSQLGLHSGYSINVSYNLNGETVKVNK